METAATEILEGPMLRTTPLESGTPPDLADPGRVCVSCDTILRRTNLGDTCSACQLRAPASEPEPDVTAPARITTRDLILDALPGRVTEVAERLGMRRDSVGTALHRMHARGLVERSGVPGRANGHGGVVGGYVYWRPSE